jgi:type IV pilus assembly protein PilB
VSTLANRGFLSRVVATQAELAPTDDDVIVAPLPAMEALVAAGAHPKGSVIVAVKSPETDLPRAQRVGARGYLATPVDEELLARAVRRCTAGSKAG